MDISAEAVNDAIQEAHRAGVTIKAQVADLESGYHLETAAYDAIICFNYLHRPLIPR